MKVEIQIPSSLSEITLEQYQKFTKINTDENQDSSFLMHKTVELFCNLNLQDIAKIKFIYVQEILNDIRDISYVITHTSPHFADPVNKGHIVLNYAEDDETLIADLNEERGALTTMYEILNKNNNIIKWIYGHFHRSNSMIYENTEFLLLDINELKEIFWGGSAPLG